MHTPAATIILLSGASSSGKTTLARQLQLQLPHPFLHVQLDAFIQMLPDHHSIDDFYRMVTVFHHSVAAMARLGNNLIIDHVLLDNDWLHQCVRLFVPHTVLFVGVQCGLEELERREKTRDARRQGFARSQFQKIHAGKTYDLTVNTETDTPTTCTAQILDFYNTQSPRAFQVYQSAPHPPQTP